MKCSYRDCYCPVSSEDEFCSAKCKASDLSERPVAGCRCKHDTCDEDEEDDDDEDEDDDDCDHDDDE